MLKIKYSFLILFALVGCTTQNASETGSSSSQSTHEITQGAQNKRIGGATEKQEKEIKALVEQLVLADKPATNQPMRNPTMKIYNAKGEVVKPSGDPKKAEDYRKKFESCQKAFEKLYEFKGLAFPILIEHLDDKRQSLNFRNHYLNNSVGDACYWNIYYQLMDQPEDYSEYGYSREGRDGKNHPKPYWEGTPFDEAGGIKEWLKQNKDLNYVEMQIKCLQWLLEKEKQIGVPDAESYFLNILPLEIQILKRRQENGEEVQKELERLQKIRDNKLSEEIPQKLLPD